MKFCDIPVSGSALSYRDGHRPVLFSALVNCNKIWRQAHQAGLYDPDRLLRVRSLFWELAPDGSKSALGGNLAGGISEIFEVSD